MHGMTPRCEVLGRQVFVSHLTGHTRGVNILAWRSEVRKFRFLFAAVSKAADFENILELFSVVGSVGATLVKSSASSAYT